MSSPRRVGIHAEQHYTVTVSHQRAHTNLARSAPHPDVVAAAEKYLLTTAARRRKALQRPVTLYAVQETAPEDDVPTSHDR